MSETYRRGDIYCADLAKASVPSRKAPGPLSLFKPA